MEKLEKLKEMILEYKYWIIGGIVALIFLGIIVFLGCKNLFIKEDEIPFETINKQGEMLEEKGQETISCQIIVDIKGEVMKPGSYRLDCESRVQDAIDIAGGTTALADTSVLNLSQKIVDEMVIVIYSKEQVSDFLITKQEEKEKQTACVTQQEPKNDACIKENDLANSIVDSNNTEDTPVKVLVSLNKASKQELITLPGIGESKAEKIIEYRNEHGKFQTIEELKNVKGIGDKIFEKIKNNITV